MKRRICLLLALTIVFSLALPCRAETALPLAGKIVILHSNDVHGRAVEDLKEPAIGYARIARIRERYEDLGAEVLLFDAGDAMQGMPIVNLSQGAQAFDFMNAVGYDAMCPGNHEFSWGSDNLLAAAERAQFPILCANITRKSDGEALFPANKLFTMKSGVKLGVFGLTTPATQTKVNPDKVKNLDFSGGEALCEEARAQVEALRAEGCDLIVCLAHLGVDEGSAPDRSTDLIDQVQGIDLFIDGHSHTVVNEMRGDTLLVQTGCYGHNLGAVLYDGKTLTETLIPAVDEDEAVAELVNGVNDEIQKQLSEVFAKSEVLLDGERSPGVRTMETNLGDLTADAVLWTARNAVGEGVVAALTNGGGIRSSIQAGDISMNDIKTVFPFGNRVCVLTVSGAELLEALEASTFSLPDPTGAFPQVAGIVYSVDTASPFEPGEQYPNSSFYAPAKPGSRVSIETIGGEAFDPDKLYTIATNDFTAAGGDSYYVFRYANSETGIDTGIVFEDAMIGYIQNRLGGTVGQDYAQPQNRITVR